ncbi:pyruvate dehydrogenase E1 component beta subunit [Propionibacterium cyclohexanicum]|uniref:Pyruvate dehydrogenase E1 component beta subunit n=1 Tax=Propionibacterium cyclohexanicum TaxID=64702 RepID=A0A1H9T3Q6_9ACTN|nr:alpha-ketoacid dehydrogenase subunit beta [Propionibacterium cyclohexanicum]SER91771.1 pyruvate dehydrogenase E1 component beta subunit [Propionibacterium cyclohexanicum]
MTTLTLAKALNAGLRASMDDDPKVVLMGEDIGALGGVFRITEGLREDFGPDRVIDTPLAEAGIVGAAIGLALRGYRPVVEIQFDGFVFPAFDQIVNQLARYRSRTHGRVSLPVVIRIPFGGGIGAAEHHSESPESYFVHTPGLQVVSCATPHDAYWLIRQAIACLDPVIFFEPKRRYYAKGDVDLAAPDLAMQEARTVRRGDDLTVLCYGPMVQTCLDAAKSAAAEGRELEVIDLRSLAPFDMATIRRSVHRTHRAIVVHEAHRTLGPGAELAARLDEEFFAELAAPVLRVAGWDTVYPPARSEMHYLPTVERVLDAVDASFSY